MFTVTLLTNPETPVLSRMTVEALRNAWGGGDAIWLDPGVAAEFPVESLPDNRWQVWEDLQSLKVDLAVQKTEGRRKRLLIADMDSTMIQQECIDELADEAGVGAYVAGITARAMNGELEFDAALRERVGLLKDLPEEVIARAMNGELEFDAALRERVGLLKDLPEAVIARVIRDRITLMPGAEQLLATMKAKGAYTALVSGGFTAFTGAIAARLGFDENRANLLLAEAGKLTGEVGLPILGKEAKVVALEEITAKLGITEAEAIAVGDGANDLPMLKRAGAGVALHAKPKVQAEAEIRINHGDLTALLYLQGYAREEFAL